MRDDAGGLPVEGAYYRIVVPAQARVRWVRSIGTLLAGSDNEPRRIAGLHFDATTERGIKEALRVREEALRLSKTRLDLAFNAGRDGVFDADIATGSCLVSPSWAAHLGYTDSPQTIAFWEGLIHREDWPIFDAERTAFLTGGKPAFEHEHRQRRADGGYIWVLMQVTPVGPEARGYPLRVMGTMVDITERKEIELRIAHLADHDPLTGLRNRRGFHRCLADALTGTNGPTALLVCDLDRFRAVNDTKGNLVGDAVLVEAARRIAGAVPSAPCVARVGGDEFAVLLTEAAEVTARDACSRIIAALSEPICVDSGIFNIGTSIGLAWSKDGEGDGEALFKRADIALYEAKQTGRGKCNTYAAETYQRIVTRSSLALDIRGALERGELFILYQPVINVRTGAITSFEALLNWRHPDHGIILPGEAIPLAEETGMMAAFGSWVLREACAEATNWPAAVRIAVNISAAQLTPAFRDAVLTALVGAGLPASRLKLEVAESALMDGVEPTLALLHELQALGVRIALDDFGKGYCSLTHLRRLSFDKIKIDRTFIRDINQADAAAMVRAVVEIGDRLKIGIVAEGITTAEQFDRVRAEGCEEVQGPFLSPPLYPDEVRRIVTSAPPWRLAGMVMPPEVAPN